jgi:hypothetical protein
MSSDSIGGGKSQLDLTPSGRPREKNVDEVDTATLPRPCRFCGVTVPHPEVVCERQKCRDKLGREHELDTRIRNRLDRQRDA